MSYTTRSVTVASGDTISGVVDLLGGSLVAIACPTLDADTKLQFLAAPNANDISPDGDALTAAEIALLDYLDVVDESGTRYEIPVGTGEVWVGLDSCESLLKGARYLQLELSVQTTAAREFTFVIKC